MSVVRSPTTCPRFCPKASHEGTGMPPVRPRAHPLFDVAHHVDDAKRRHARSITTARRSLPEAIAFLSGRLGVPSKSRKIDATPALVGVAKPRLDLPPVGPGPVLRALASEFPFGFGAQTLAASSAPLFGASKRLQHERARPAAVRCFELVDAHPYLRRGSDLHREVGVIAVAVVCRSVATDVDAPLSELVVVSSFDHPHIRGAAGGGARVARKGGGPRRRGGGELEGQGRHGDPRIHGTGVTPRTGRANVGGAGWFRLMAVLRMAVIEVTKDTSDAPWGHPQ